jgi:hypothetical protein
MKVARIMTAVTISALFATALAAAEWREVELSTVPPEVRTMVARLSYGTNATYFRTNLDSPRAVWRVVVQQPEHRKAYLVHTKQMVAGGQTNVLVERIEPVRPAK